MRKDILIKILSLFNDRIDVRGDFFDTLDASEIVYNIEDNIIVLDEDPMIIRRDLKEENINYKCYNLHELMEDIINGNLANIDFSKLTLNEKEKILSNYLINDKVRKVIYIVHCDIDEQNDGNKEFYSEDEAINYAKEIACNDSYVDKIILYVHRDDEEDILDEEPAERIWESWI